MAGEFRANRLNALFAEMAEQEERREREKREAVLSQFEKAMFPTPEPIARAIVWSAPSKRAEFLRHHPYWKERKLRLGLDALISAALSAHLDLTRCEAALVAYGASRDSFEDHLDHTVGHPAQKEVMAFCTAYTGVIDTLRRLTKSVRTDLYDQARELGFDALSGPEFRFLRDLRNNLAHGSVTMPGWWIQTDFETTIGAMRFAAAELLAFGDWSSESKQYLRDAPDGHIAISAITAKCSSGLARLRRALHMLFARNRTAAEIDYYELDDLGRRLLSGQSLKIFLNGHAAKGTDPYPHLHRIFEPEVAREILRRPRHSQEQVEFIISLRAAQTHCDDDLREMLYKLFRVESDRVFEREPPSLDPKPLGKLWPHE